MLRNSAGILLVIASARFAYFEAKLLITGLSANEEQGASHSARSADDPSDLLDPLRQSALERRLDLKQLNDEKTSAPPVVVARDTDDATQLRRIIVDLGPERSKVFINGTHVGQTPYGGQLSCGNKANIELVVLPETGPPLRRILTCAGTHINVVH